LTNSPTWKTTGLATAIKFSNPAGLTFDGTNYVQFTTPKFINPISVSAWVYKTADGNYPRVIILPFLRFYITHSGGTPSHDAVGLLQDCPRGTDGNWQSPTDSFTSNAWHHIAATYDGSSITNDPIIYIDGQVQTVTQVTAPAHVCLTGSGTSYIGSAAAAANPFTGSIDDVRIYEGILSQAQITRLAAGRHAGTASTSTFTLGGDTTVNGQFTVDNGTVDMSSRFLKAG